MEYLIAYSFNTNTGRSGNGNVNITHKTHFKSIDQLRETEQLIRNYVIKNNPNIGEPRIIIQNIIKFPIK